MGIAQRLQDPRVRDILQVIYKTRPHLKKRVRDVVEEATKKKNPVPSTGKQLFSDIVRSPGAFGRLLSQKVAEPFFQAPIETVAKFIKQPVEQFQGLAMQRQINEGHQKLNALNNELWKRAMKLQPGDPKRNRILTYLRQSEAAQRGDVSDIKEIAPEIITDPKKLTSITAETFLLAAAPGINKLLGTTLLSPTSRFATTAAVRGLEGAGIVGGLSGISAYGEGKGTKEIAGDVLSGAGVGLGLAAGGLGLSYLRGGKSSSVMEKEYREGKGEGKVEGKVSTPRRVTLEDVSDASKLKAGDTIVNKELGRFVIDGVVASRRGRLIEPIVRITSLESGTRGYKYEFLYDEINKAGFKRVVSETSDAVGKGVKTGIEEGVKAVEEGRKPTAEAPLPPDKGLKLQVPEEKPVSRPTLAEQETVQRRELNLDIPETEGTRSRAKQVPEQFSFVRNEIERSPEFRKTLEELGGGKVISNREIIAEAEKLGAMPAEELKATRVGDPVNTVDVVRSYETVGRQFEKVRSAMVDKNPEAYNAAVGELQKLWAGFTTMTAEPARATQIQSLFSRAFKEMGTAVDVGEVRGGERGFSRIQDALRILESDSRGAPALNIALRTLDMINEYATAIKLSRPLTHLVNVVGNSLALTVGIAERGVSVTIGALRGRQSFRALTKQFGTVNGWKLATTRFIEVVKNERAIDASKLDLRRPYAIPGLAGKAIRMPFRFLTAADEFGKSILRDIEISTKAMEIAKKEGLKGVEFENRVSEVIHGTKINMLARKLAATEGKTGEAYRARVNEITKGAQDFPDVSAAANKRALEFTFQEDLPRGLRELSNALAIIPGGKLIVPFFRTPTNIVRFFLRRTPQGVLAGENLKGLLKGGTARDEAVARLVIGSVATVGTAMYALEGNVLGAAPRSAKERERFYAQGKKPYSFRVGDTWISYQRFQPVGMYFAQAAAFADALKRGEEEGALNALSAGAISFASSFTELPFVSGLSDTFEAINDPEGYKAKNFVNNTILSTLLPTVSRDATRYIDPVIREREGLVDEFKSRFPFLSQSLPPKVDALGQEVKQQGSPFRRAFFNIYSIENITPFEQSLIDAEYMPPTVSGKISGYEVDSAQEKQIEFELGEATKEAIEKMIERSIFRNADQEKKKDLLEQVVDKARTRVRNQWKRKLNKTEK